MLLTPAGEDSVAVCGACGYRANVEAAACVAHNEPPAVLQPLQTVETPDAHTIEALCAFLHVIPAQCCKAVVYQKETDGSYVVLFLRGDLEPDQADQLSGLRCPAGGYYAGKWPLRGLYRSGGAVRRDDGAV